MIDLALCLLCFVAGAAAERYICYLFLKIKPPRYMSVRFPVSKELSKNLDKRAGELVAAADPLQVDGEYKRHSVYAKLLEEFPRVKRSTVAMAIEVAVQEHGLRGQ